MKKSRRTNGLAPPRMNALGTNFVMNIDKGNNIGPPMGTNSQLDAAHDNMCIGTIGQIG